jgi:hypothetical protein
MPVLVRSDRPSPVLYVYRTVLRTPLAHLAAERRADASSTITGTVRTTRGRRQQGGWRYVYRTVLRRPLATRRPSGGPMPVVLDHYRYCTYIVLYYERRWPLAADGRADASSTVRTNHHRNAPARRLAFNGTYTAGYHSGLTALKSQCQRRSPST